MHERKDIGRRISQALQYAKKREVRLWTAGSRKINKANHTRISAANTFTEKLQTLVMPIRKKKRKKYFRKSQIF